MVRMGIAKTRQLLGHERAAFSVDPRHEPADAPPIFPVSGILSLQPTFFPAGLGVQKPRQSQRREPRQFTPSSQRPRPSQQDQARVQRMPHPAVDPRNDQFTPGARLRVGGSISSQVYCSQDPNPAPQSAQGQCQPNRPASRARSRPPPAPRPNGDHPGELAHDPTAASLHETVRAPRRIRISGALRHDRGDAVGVAWTDRQTGG